MVNEAKRVTFKTEVSHLLYDLYSTHSRLLKRFYFYHHGFKPEAILI